MCGGGHREGGAWEEESVQLGGGRDACEVVLRSFFQPKHKVGKALRVKAQVSQARQLRAQSASGNGTLSFHWGVQFSEGQISGLDKASLDVLVTKGGLNS